MYQLFFYPKTYLLILFFLGVIVFAVQSVVLSTLLSTQRKQKFAILAAEILLLLYIANLSLLAMTVFYNKRYGLIDIASLDVVLKVLGVMILLFWMVWNRNKQRVPYFLFFSLLALLMNEVWYHWHLLALFPLLFHTMKEARYLQKKRKQEISAFSIKEGLDTLPAGLMFCDTQGYIYLINEKMKSWMLLFTNHEFQDGNMFWKKLEKGPIVSAEIQNIEGDILLRTSSQAIRFSKKEFKIKNQAYYEMIAIDVTETMGVFYLLEEEMKKLSKQREEIQELNIKMETLQKEREYVRLRSQIHDILGQKLTAIQRLSHNSVKGDELLSLLEDIMDQIKGNNQGDSKSLFADIKEYFERIGLLICLQGEFPVEEELCFLFLAVLREACTNAIRHAGASEVYVVIEKKELEYKIAISNNGGVPRTSLREGGGLFGIRNRMESIGGSLKVEVIPEFCLMITMPRREI